DHGIDPLLLETGEVVAVKLLEMFLDLKHPILIQRLVRPEDQDFSFLAGPDEGILIPELFKFFLRLLHIGRLLHRDVDPGSALEIDAQIEPLDEKGEDPRPQEDSGDKEEPLPLADKIPFIVHRSHPPSRRTTTTV